MFTKEEYVEWRSNKVTTVLIKLVSQNVIDRLEEVADGKVDGNELYRELGRVQGIKDMLQFLLNKNGELKDLIIEEEQYERQKT